MKDLILPVLENFLRDLIFNQPLYRRGTIQHNIDDVSPLGLASYMADHNIPANAYFSINAKDDYDGYDRYNPCLYLEWRDDKIPTTEDDRAKWIATRYKNGHFKRVYEVLTANGYKRVGFNSGRLRDYDDTTPYQMFISGEYDRLVEYYSLSFEKV